MSKFETKNDIPDTVRKLLVDKVHENWDELMDAMMNLAKGVWVQDIKYDDQGSPINAKVYQQKPDRDVGKYLMDQVIGKPKESMNIEGKVNLIIDEDLTNE